MLWRYNCRNISPELRGRDEPDRTKEGRERIRRALEGLRRHGARGLPEVLDGPAGKRFRAPGDASGGGVRAQGEGPPHRRVLRGHGRAGRAEGPRSGP